MAVAMITIVMSHTNTHHYLLCLFVVMPYHAMPYHAILCDAILCDAMPFHAMPPYYAMLCDAMIGQQSFDGIDGTRHCFFNLKVTFIPYPTLPYPLLSHVSSIYLYHAPGSIHSSSSPICR